MNKNAISVKNGIISPVCVMRKKIEFNLLEENYESSEELFLQVEEISTVESCVKRWFGAGSAFTVNKPSMKPPSSAILILVRLAMYSAAETHLLHKMRIHLNRLMDT